MTEDEARRQAALTLYTIYANPRDFPGYYVVRAHDVLRTGGTQARRDFRLADSLEAARRHIPPGLYNIGREPGDDHTIVETWI